MRTQKIFTDLEASISAYQRSVTDTLKKYQADAERNAEFYKESALKAQRQQAAAAASEALRLHQENFTTTMSGLVDSLKAEYQASTAQMPLDTFMNRLRFFKDFSVSPTRFELEGLVKENGGRPLGIRALNAVLEQTGSRLRVNVPGAAELESDISMLERMAAEPLWSPHDSELLHSFLEVTHLQTTSVLNASTTFNFRAAAVEEMQKRWVNALPPVIEDLDAVDRRAALEEELRASVRVADNAEIVAADDHSEAARAVIQSKREALKRSRAAEAFVKGH